MATTNEKTGRKVTGLVLGNELCDLFGIPNAGVREISISADAQDAAFIVIKRYLTESEADNLRTHMMKYSICENESMGE